MCQGDCLNQFLNLSRMKKEIEDKLEKEVKVKLNLSLNEFYVLYFLNLEPNQKMRIFDLQEKIGLTHSAMSRLIARMEQKEIQFIERTECCVDKRGVCIVLTQKGQKQVATHLDKVHDTLVPYHDFLRKVTAILKH